MVFKSDRQRKAVMAKLNQGQTRSDTKPSILGRLKAKEKELLGRLKQRRERKGKERIAKQLEAQEKEAKQLKRLQAELALEQSRERIGTQRREAQAEFKRIEKERFARTKTGGVIALAVKGIKQAEARARARPKPRKKRGRPVQETGFFGI